MTTNPPTDRSPSLAELEIRSELFDAMDGNLRMRKRHKLLDAYRDAVLASAPTAEQPPVDRAAVRDRIVTAIKTAPFEELRTVGYAPNGPLQITIRVEELADAILRAVPAAVSVPPPTRADDRAALRDRIADAMCVCGEPETSDTVHRTDGPCYVDTRIRVIALAIARVDAQERATGERLEDQPLWQMYLAYARAVLAVLPPPTDRAAVLLWAADELGRMDYDTDSNDYGYDTYRDAWNGGVMDGSETLCRLAAEAQPGPGVDLIEDYLKFLRGQGPEPDLSHLSAEQRAAITGQFEIVKALVDRDQELPPLECDSVARRLGLADEAQQPTSPTAFSPDEGIHGRDPYYASGDTEAQQQPDTETPASTAPLAAGLPLVKGRCPACGRASLFLGSGGYVTCSVVDCREPDAATTVLEQPASGPGRVADEDTTTETSKADRIVGYRSNGGRLLRCLAHHPGQEALDSGDFHPVTSEDLPDGGICTFPVLGSGAMTCGVDVLIPQAPQ